VDLPGSTSKLQVIDGPDARGGALGHQVTPVTSVVVPTGFHAPCLTCANSVADVWACVGVGGEATKLGNQTPKDRTHDALDQMKDRLLPLKQPVLHPFDPPSRSTYTSSGPLTITSVTYAKVPSRGERDPGAGASGGRPTRYPSLRSRFPT